MSGAGDRLFFAWWPDAAQRAALVGGAAPALAGVVGRAVPAAQLHVTLEFLGAVAESALAGLVALGAAFRGSALTLTLDEREWWPASGALVLAASSPPPAALAQQTRLRQALAALGHRVDARPWRAHLTLARGVVAAPAPMAPLTLRLPVRTLALVASRAAGAGRTYRALATWPLAGESA